MVTLFQINVEVNFSSTGRIAEGIGNLALSESWDSYIAYGRKTAVSNSKIYKVGSDLSVFLHVLQTRFTGKHGEASKTATKKLIDKLDEIRPDIIQLHNLHGYYLNLEFLFEYLRGSGVPIVYSLHDLWSITGHCPQFEHVSCEKWKSTCHSCPLLKDYPKSIFLDRSTRNHQLKKRLMNNIPNLQLVTSSAWSASKIAQSHLSPYPLEIIPNGVDLNVFYPRSSSALKEKLGLSGKFVMLGVTNVWTVLKGYDDFLALASNLRSDEIIMLIGLSKKQIEKLPAGIIGLERTKDVSELADYYAMADVFVNLTYADTFPTTNLEALACGTPLITYNTGGSVESVNPETGFVVEKGNLEELRSAIDAIQEKGSENYSVSCSELAKEEYNKITQFGKYIELYKKILKITEQNKLDYVIKNE